MPGPVIHSRQFILGPRVVEPNAEWISDGFENGLIVSHCPKLKVASASDRKGRKWLLLGNALQTDPNRPSPAEDLRRTEAEDISSVYDSWAGRWVLIGDGGVHLDVSGLLGCFYRVAFPGNGERELWVSSSLPLLATLPGLAPASGQQRPLRYGNHRWLMEWDPPPRTYHEEIRKILPTQVLDTSSGETRPRPMRLHVTPQSYDQVLDELGQRLATAMKNIEGPVWLALTAGLDSRLLMAAGRTAGISFRTYTQTFPEMSRADRALPPVLAKLAGVDHRYIHPEATEQRLLDVFDAHCGQQNVDADRDFFARKQWFWTDPEDALVRGLGFEIGMCRYFDHLPPDPITADAVLRRFAAQESPAYVRESVAEYLDWASRTPFEGIDWRDRFYLEVRFAGWASSEEQSLDIVEGNRIHPANAAAIARLLLAVPAETRSTRQHHVDLIGRLSPDFLQFPFNEPDGFIRVTKKRLKKYAALLRERGLAAALGQADAAIRARLRHP